MERHFVTQIRDLMAAKGLSSRSLSMAAGLNETAVRDILSGKSKTPRVRTVVKIARALQVHISQILDESEMDEFEMEQSSYDRDEDILTTGELNLHNIEWARKMSGHSDSTNFAGADLTGAILRGANFERANFAGANLTRADMTGANLRGANFAGAKVLDAIFIDADLTGAAFAGVDLTKAIFKAKT